MKKKYNEDSEEENEFDVDEPEEIQNNASDDDWTPDKDATGGRRTSTRLRNIPKSRAPIIDASSTDEEGSDESHGSKRKGSKVKGRGRQPIKKHKVSSSSPAISRDKGDNGTSKTVSSDSEPSSTTTNSSSATPTVIKVNKDFTSGAFVILKTDAANFEQDPPLWKIDGKALLQKYIPFQQDEKTFYKNTSVYSGWTINNKDNYYPVSVIFKQQTRKEHIVEFHRDQIKLGRKSEVTSRTKSKTTEKQDSSSSNDNLSDSGEKPVIKVKSFAVLPAEEVTTPRTPISEKTLVPSNNSITPIASKVDKDFISGAFLVLRIEAANVDPPLWKIDGKALLQKYNAFKENGKTQYKSSAEYSGWSLTSKSNYFPVSVVFKQQIKKEHIVELKRIKWDEPEDSS